MIIHCWTTPEELGPAVASWHFQHRCQPVWGCVLCRWRQRVQSRAFWWGEEIKLFLMLCPAFHRPDWLSPLFLPLRYELPKRCPCGLWRLLAASATRPLKWMLWAGSMVGRHCMLPKDLFASTWLGLLWTCISFCQNHRLIFSYMG